MASGETAGDLQSRAIVMEDAISGVLHEAQDDDETGASLADVTPASVKKTSRKAT